MTFEVPASKASIEQNQFKFKVPGEKGKRSLPLLKFLPIGLRSKLAEAAGPIAAAQKADRKPDTADLEKIGTLQLALLEKYSPGVSDLLDTDQLGALLVAWQEASGVTVGESAALPDS